MDPITAAIGLGVSAFGMFSSNKAGKEQDKLLKKQYEISQRIAAVSRKQEKVRQEEAREQYQRTVRNSIRQQNLARASSLSNLANSGAMFSSATPGALSGIAQEGAQQRSDLFSSFQRGEQMFKLNAQIGNLQTQYARVGGQINSTNRDIATGQSLFALGSSITSNSSKFAKAFDFLI